jgi:hypothetical protein
VTEKQKSAIQKYLEQEKAQRADTIEVTLRGGLADGTVVKVARKVAIIPHFIALPRPDDAPEPLPGEAIPVHGLQLVYQRADQDATEAAYLRTER